MNVKEWLEKRGYDVHMADFGRESCDLIINIGDRAIAVEVKTAYRTYRKNVLCDGRISILSRWQWRKPKSHSDDWIAILVAIDDDDNEFPFIVPGAVLANRQHVQITSHPLDYSGYLKPFLENTQVIDFSASKKYANGGPLFIQ